MSQFRLAVALSATAMLWPVNSNATENETPERQANISLETFQTYLDDARKLVEQLRTCAYQSTCNVEPIISEIDRKAVDAYGATHGQVSRDSEEDSQPCFKKRFFQEVGTSQIHLDLARLVNYEAFANSLSPEARRHACIRSHSDLKSPEIEVLVQKLCENSKVDSLDEVIQQKGHNFFKQNERDFCPYKLGNWSPSEDSPIQKIPRRPSGLLRYAGQSAPSASAS